MEWRWVLGCLCSLLAVLHIVVGQVNLGSAGLGKENFYLAFYISISIVGSIPAR